MAVHNLLRGADGSKASAQQLGTADTGRVPGDFQVDGTVLGPDDGTGVVVGAPGAAPNSGSTLQVRSFTTTQRDFLVPVAGMVIYNSTDQVVQAYANGVWRNLPSERFDMTLGGQLDTADLPLSGAGAEIASAAGTLVMFSGRRGVAGSSGTTTVQLEINGSPVVGAVLSWVPGDADFTLKSVAISQAVAANDRVSFRLTSAETDAEDIYAEAHS